MSKEQTLKKIRELPIPDIFIGTPDYTEIPLKMDKVFRNNQIWGEIITILRNEGTLSSRGKSLFFAQNIMVLTEGPIQFFINLIIYTLVKSEHHDIYDPRTERFVYSLEDISDIILAIKIKFLKTHGFDYFEVVCAKDIRNAVAHQNIEIEENGTLITNKKRKYGLEKLASISDNSYAFLHDIFKIIEQNTA